MSEGTDRSTPTTARHHRVIARTRNLVTSLVASALVLGVAPLSPVEAADTNAIAARVNGTPIRAALVDDVVHRVAANRSRPPSADEMARLRQSALDSLIDLELLYQEAQAEHIQVTDREIDAEIAHTRSHFADKAQFESALKASGLSVERLRSDTRKTLMVSRLRVKLAGPDAPVTDEDIDRFYAAHQKELGAAPEIRVSDILVRVPPGTSITERAAALERANQIAAALRAGAAFATVARERSEDPQSASAGGDLGFKHPGQLPAPIEDAVFSLQPGQISDVVEAPDGYHILTVTETKAKSTTAPAAVRADIAKLLRAEGRQQREAELVKRLRDQATIEIAPAGGAPAGG